MAYILDIFPFYMLVLFLFINIVQFLKNKLVYHFFTIFLQLSFILGLLLINKIVIL